MNNERYAHDFRKDMNGVAYPSKLSGRITVVGGDNYEAVLIELARFQIGKEISHALIDFVQFKSDPVIEPRAGMPVSSVHTGHVVTGKLVDIHGLGIKQYGPAFVLSGIQCSFELLNGGTGFETIPERFVRIQLHHI